MTNKQMTMNNLGDDTRFSNEEPMENPETQQELIAALHESNRKLHTLIDSNLRNLVIIPIFGIFELN